MKVRGVLEGKSCRVVATGTRSVFNDCKVNKQDIHTSHVTRPTSRVTRHTLSTNLACRGVQLQISPEVQNSLAETLLASDHFKHTNRTSISCRMTTT